MGASWGGSWQGTKWGWCASHLCSCSRCLQVPASTGALRGGTGPKWYSGRTACGLALGGWEVAEGMEAGRGGLSALARELVEGCEYTRPAWTQAEMSC